MNDSFYTLLAEFAWLGGYGRYVWPAYGLTLALLLIEPWLVRRRLARALQQPPVHDHL